MIGGGRGWFVGLGFGVHWDSFISDLSDISVVVVSGVLDVLGTAVGKSNGVRSGDNTLTVGSLSSVEVGL